MWRGLTACVPFQAGKQRDAEEKLQKARNAAAAAQERSREAARQAAESRERAHHLESTQDSLLAERDTLQKQVRIPQHARRPQQCSVHTCSLPHDLHDLLLAYTSRVA